MSNQYWSDACELVKGPKRFFVAQVSKKFTKEASGEAYTITTSGSEVGLPNELEKISGVKVDGYTNYVDYIEIDSDDTHWKWIVECKSHLLIQMRVEEWLKSGEYGGFDNTVFKALMSKKTLDEIYLICYMVLGDNTKAYKSAQWLEHKQVFFSTTP